jgi:hypothetical protein
MQILVSLGLFFLGIPLLGWAAESTHHEPLVSSIAGERIEVLPPGPYAEAGPRLAATRKHAYRYAEASWQRVFSAPGEAAITALAYGADDRFWVGTTAGLFTAGPNSITMKPVVLSSADEADQINTLALTETTLWVGTQRGLYRIDLHAAHPQRVALPGKETAIAAVASLPRDPQVWVLTTDNLLIHNPNLGAWEVAAFTAASEQLGGEVLDDATGEEENNLPFLRALAVNPSTQTFYIAHATGVDAAHQRTQQPLPSAGLPQQVVDHLVWLPLEQGVLVAGTAHGLALWRAGAANWVQPKAGYLQAAVYDIEAGRDGLWVANSLGLFKIPLQELSLDRPQPIPVPDQQGPDIRAVQDAAIRYAEVHPDKIRRWRQQARWKALLPQLSLGYEYNDNNYITSRGSTDDSSTDRIITAADPSAGFDVSLSWDLDELIWNDDQTSIDNRSKLMVQLREDTVDQVTRLYFERKRLLTEQVPEDAKKATERALRIEELTALIDGFTGGFFSRALKQ